MPVKEQITEKKINDSKKSSQRNTVLLIDDEKDIRNLLSRLISLEGYEVIQADSGVNALKKAKTHSVHTILCDVKLPDASGLDLIQELKKIQPESEVILLTAHGSIQDGVQAIKLGAFDYLTKGDDNHRIIPLLSKATEKAKLQYRIAELERQVKRTFTFESIVGKAESFNQAIDMAKKVSHTDSTVLLTGPTGSGKEVFSQSIHNASLRSKQSFITVNCSAIGSQLLESEMFGHVKGAFTGAEFNKVGLFEEADKGTIFLDEIGEMDLQLQAKMLRVLEYGTFMKVGSTKEQRVDVRIIAATNRDLRKESLDGKFRLDLFYRLSVFNIELPSLNERLADIPVLTKHFAEIASAKIGKKPLKLSKPYIKALIQHHWRGNLRELKNIVERSIILTEGDIVELDSLPMEIQLKDEASIVSLGMEERHPAKLTTVVRNHIIKVLKSTNGNKTKTAELLGIGLTTLYRKMEEYRIEK